MTSGPGAPILVVDSIAEGAALDVEAIRAALRHRRSTDRGSEFLGRSTTQVWADERAVVKVRPDLAIPFREGDPMADRVRWVQARLERERAIRGYQDDRTWFLIGEGERVHAGVAASRLRPLHLWDDPEFAANWAWFAHEFAALYLRAAEEGWRLDEGFSNFAPAAPGGPLRYLDDDLYAWDRGTGLRYGLAVLGRSRRALTAAQGELLGNAFRDELDRHHPILDTRGVGEDLRADGRGNDFLTALSGALLAPRSARRPAPRRNGEVRRVALVSDVHANLAGLDAVLATDDLQGADEILFLGDAVGYGPDPIAVIDRLRADPRVRVVRGNHDHAMVEPAQLRRFTKDARWSAEWTAERLDPERRAWLAAMPLELIEQDWIAVHGAPADPTRFNAYIYSMSCDDSLDRLELDGTPLCFYGNTHVPGAWVRAVKGMPGRFLGPEEPIVVDDFRAVLVCPGSVGQPRDGRPGASYAMFDRKARTVRWELVHYDWAPVQQRMRDAGFPPRLLDRLDDGH